MGTVDTNHIYYHAHLVVFLYMFNSVDIGIFVDLEYITYIHTHPPIRKLTKPNIKQCSLSIPISKYSPK